MPLNARNCRTFHRTLYAGQLESVVLMKRGDDQQYGIVTPIRLYQCRRSAIAKAGEPLAEDMASAGTTVWHIPRIELDRVGVGHINALDRIVDGLNRSWQPESDTIIEDKLFETRIKIACRRRDTPANQQLKY